MSYDVLVDPNPILREPTENVECFDMGLQTLIDGLIETMRANNRGIGLAAPQVGVLKNIFICEYAKEVPTTEDVGIPADSVGKDKKDKEDKEDEAFPLTVFINPEIVSVSKDKVKMVEGCLSFPNSWLIIERPKKIKIKAFDRYGKPFEIEADGLFSRVIQHENDHLNATLMIDHLKELNLIFFGSGDFAVETLNEVIKDRQYHITALVTKTTETISHGKKTEENKLEQIAHKANIPVLFADRLENAELEEKIKKLKPDIGLVVDYGLIIPKDIYEIPKYKTLNIHPSLLPKYRGSSPIQSAIINGEKKIGITLMQINDVVDAGPVISQIEVKLKGKENYQAIYEYLSELGAALFLDSTPYYILGDLKPKTQKETKATMTEMIKKEDGRVDANTQAVVVERKIRALYPWPGVYTTLVGLQVKITAAHLDKEKKLVIDRVIPSGKKEMSYADFVRGYKKELTFPL